MKKVLSTTMAAVVLAGCVSTGSIGSHGHQKLTRAFTVDSPKVHGKVQVRSMADMPQVRREFADWGGQQGNVKPGLIRRLGYLAAETGCPTIRLNSGYRTSTHQRWLVRTGRTPAKGQGYHPLGMAADFRLYCPNGRQLPAIQVAEAAIRVGFTGVATYPGRGNPYTHADIRPRGALPVQSWGYQEARIEQMGRRYAALQQQSGTALAFAPATPGMDVPWPDDKLPAAFTIEIVSEEWDNNPFLGAGKLTPNGWKMRNTLD